MTRSDWLSGLRTTLGLSPRRRVFRVKRRIPALRRATFELLEDRRLMAVDFGDAPDAALGASPGNYNTRSADNGAQHTIVVGIRMGANVDGDSGSLHNAAALADDVTGALPDDEDGLANPAADLVLTVGAQPTVNVRVTNTPGTAATLYGWIDYNANGVFDNATERASVAVAGGTNNAIKTLVFPTVPTVFTGTTYARFRLSTDVPAANPTGAATDGEVEDYRVTITNRSGSPAVSSKTKKIGSGAGGGPTLADGDYFGRSVAALGDIDGDGITDMAVGAIGDDTGGVSRGAVNILLMNANGTVKTLGQKITGSSLGAANGDYFGSSLSSLGDLNGDGVNDLVVGAERDDTAGSNRGAIYVLYLNSNGTLKSSTKVSGNSRGAVNDDYFGRSVVSIGDIDGDGATDVAIGANGDDTGGLDRGAIYVVFLDPSGFTKGSQKIASGVSGLPALENGDKFGSSVASLGDVDGDGVSDIAVGSIYDVGGGTDRGAVHVLFMNSNGTVKSSQRIVSGLDGAPTLASGDQFGNSLAAVGDLDGNGVTDLAVGANYDDTGGTKRGAVYLLFMNSNGTVKAHQKIASGMGGAPSLANDDRFGASVAAMGDLDGDGRTDLAVGANFDDSGGTNRGVVYALFLSVFNSIPVFTSPATANVPENTTAVMTVTATDAEAPPQTVTFSLVGGADQTRFSISNGGVLTFNSAPNYEGPTDANGDNVYVVTVRVSDGLGGTATQTINVTVTPVNENPVITSPSIATVAENSTAVMTITAMDEELPLPAGIIITSQVQDTPGLAGFKTHVLTATSTVPGDLVSGVDFIGDNDSTDPPTARGFFGTMNQRNPLGLATVFQDNNGEIIAAGFDPSQDSQFMVVSSQIISPDGFATEGQSFLRALYAHFTPSAQSLQFAQIVIPDGETVSYRGAFSVHRGDTFVGMPEIAGTLSNLAMSFSIVGGDDQGKFGVTSDGVLTFNSAPDFEAPTDANGDNVYVVTVQASDGDGRTTQKTIEVTVTNANESIPVFTSPTSASVAENSLAVMAVTATDADLPAQTLLYSIVGGADEARFAITSGRELTFTSSPDYDAPTDADGDNVYVVTVQASDGAGGNTQQTIDVTVTALNDNNPVFTSSDSASVAENSTAVITVTATDADLPAQSLSYSIVGGADEARFQIDGEGALTFTAAPDFEAPTDANGDSVYEVTVQASDGHGGTTLQTIHVTVLDNSPVFTSPDSASVAENSTAVLTVTATDSDLPAQSLSYSIVGGADQANFGLTSGGELTFNSGPDFEVPTDANADNVYEVIVQASDGNGRTSLQTIEVTVTPFNDNVPVYSSPDSASVEDGSTTVMTVTATDADLPAQSLSYSIVGGADQAKFGITSGGELTFNSPPDFHAPVDENGDNIYVVTVHASDGNGGLTEQTINVTVTPVKPVFTSPNAASVPENTAAVMTVAATDVEAPPQILTFSIAGGADQGKFSITGDGVLSFLSARDYEHPTDADHNNAYVVTIQVDNGAGGVATQTISVSVTPVNESSPVFTSPDFARVLENTIAVMAVTATDADLPSHALTFTIVGGADQATFHITAGGELTFATAPDVEAPSDANGDNVYELTVQVSDGEFINSHAILVTVTPSDDVPPVFTSPAAVSKPENLTEVLTVTATDSDVPPQSLTFSVVGGADQAKFSITSGGLLTFNSPPNFELPTDANADNVYEVTVQAGDGVGLSSSQTIQVTVIDVFEGDYNSDGTVDAADYVVWRNNVDNIVPAFSNPDGSGNGIVDQDDFKVWKSNFGNTQSMGSGASLAIASLEPEIQPQRSTVDLEILAAVLTEPEVPALVSSTSVSSFVFDVARPRNKEVRVPERRTIRSIASYDGALVAWLASRRGAVAQQSVELEVESASRTSIDHSTIGRCIVAFDFALETI